MTTSLPPAPAPAPAAPDWSRACARSAGRSRPARPRPAAAARARSRTAGWSCCRAIRPAGRAVPPRGRGPGVLGTGATWPPTSLLSSARWSGRSRRSRLARASSLRPDERRRSAASRGSRCTGWRSASSSAPGPRTRCPRSRRLWQSGAAASVDLLGEATVTAAEADRYAQRCDEALRTLAQAARLAARPRSTRRSTADPAREPVGQGHRAHRAACGPRRPSSGIEDAKHRLRDPPAHGQAGRRAPARRHGVDGLARPDHRARDRAAHRAASSGTGRARASSCRPTCATPTSSSTSLLDGYEASARPFTIRLVKGAYWEHETVEARQNGWRRRSSRPRSRATATSSG